MRSLITTEIAAVTVFITLVAVLCLVLAPVRPQMVLYPLVREAAKAKMNYQTRHMQIYETKHFTIKYNVQDEAVVSMVAKAAEQAYRPVTEQLGFHPPAKTTIILYSSRAELNKTFGWSGDQSAMGVYWGGIIQLLSPRQWLKDAHSDAEFIHSGPMVHEYTHLVLDHMTNGNYPRWFTEGLAQYMEYKINGYEWKTAGNKLSGGMYTMAELEKDFDNLPNQALAYRQSLAAVRYIAEVHGQDKLDAVIAALKKGRSMRQAIVAGLGISYEQYVDAWTKWALTNMAQ